MSETAARRTALRDDLLDRFFALMMLGGTQAVAATYVLGARVAAP